MNEGMVEAFRSKMDDDKGFLYHRRLLLIFSTILLALSIGGASILEANTFIFKIKFTNPDGLNYIIVGTVVYFILRYYAYAEEYRKHLVKLTFSRMMNDYRVFSYDSRNESIRGLLGKKIELWVGDEPGVLDAIYIVSGVFRRSILYESNAVDEEEGEYLVNVCICLNEYSGDWRRKDFIKLLSYELKYTLASIFKHREYLDVMFPFLLSIISVVSFVVYGFI
ncbi:hypothetical protein PJK54_06440 [Cobetia sp. MMG027]|uniref:hypothetical protein n=1 Tax=Cobetia sp. MMG027 TaxID=3021980 RepID=UPI0022FF1169|nr:hypothetical protein [Cobetia sp. MMG027]MDA5563300.1 hypothetical protein [Cobetia sp. MMG027]